MINSVVLMGRLTADPELRTTTTGKEVCSFSIAATRRGTEKDQNPTTDFFDIVAWQGTAKFICDYFKKGATIVVQGRLQTRSYTDKYDQKRKVVEVVADSVELCRNKKENTPKPATDNSANEGYSNASYSDFEEITDDEDLPF